MGWCENQEFRNRVKGEKKEVLEGVGLSMGIRWSLER